MKSTMRAVVYGFLLWLIPFGVAFVIFPLKQSSSPLFETIMPIVVVSAAILFINLYFAGIDDRLLREALSVGMLWMVISLAFDLSLFMWGPMKMTFAAYMADIGLVYVIYPIMTIGVGLLLQRRSHQSISSPDKPSGASWATWRGSSAMTKSELAIVIVLRVIGVTGLFAIPAIFLPYSWMNAIHDYMGLGELPDAPIVSYLARSLSAFYAIVSTITLFISSDIRRYRSFVKLWAIIVTVTGFVLLGIDMTAGMPTSWTASEGPPTIAVGLVVLWLQRKITVECDDHHEP